MLVLGQDLDSDLASSDTTAGFEAVIAETNNALFNLHLFEKDYNDQTPLIRSMPPITDVEPLQSHEETGTRCLAS